MTDGVFSYGARRALVAAFTAARSLGHSCLGSEHILLGLCGVPGDRASDALERRGVTHTAVQAALENSLGHGSGGFAAEISREAGDVLELAARLAASGQARGCVETVHLLSAVVRQTACGGYRLLRQMGVEPETLLSEMSHPAPQTRPRRARTAEPKLLGQYGVDMTARAARGEYDPLVGREQELQRVLRILCRRRKANPVLLGEAGVGKTAIAEGLAAAIAAGRVPPPLREMRLYSIDMATVVSGTKYRGEFEDKIRGILDEACACGDIILFIDELHTIAGAGAAEGAIDAGNILKPALARGSLRIVGATTPAEYRKHIEKDAALERRFQPVDVGEPDRTATMAILRASAALCRRHYGIEAGEELLGEIERMCRRFLPQRYFPDKAIDVLDEASALALTEGRRRVEDGHVRRVVSQMSGLCSLLDGPSIQPAALAEKLRASVIGQDRAVEAAVSAAAAFFLNTSLTVLEGVASSITTIRLTGLQPSSVATTACSTARTRVGSSTSTFLPSTSTVTSSSSVPAGAFTLKLSSVVKKATTSSAIFSHTASTSLRAGSDTSLATTLFTRLLHVAVPLNASSTFPWRSRTFPT